VCGVDELPAFADLPCIEELDLRHAWGVFGPDDRLGCINLLTPERVAAAALLVERGTMVSLDLPLDEPNPPLYGRLPYRHEVFALSRQEMDDRLDDFYPQASTQWDAFGHVRCREYGYWGGRTVDPTDAPTELSIDHFAEHGIAGRGVLVDVDRWARSVGRPLETLTASEITAADLADALQSQGTFLRTGDILCVRTGWTTAYRRLSARQRADFAADPRFVGLRGDEDVARFLWDAHVAAVCSDNPAVERYPLDREVGSFHRRVLALLGIALGELFDFDRLAELCLRRGAYDFFFVSVPLKLPGGLGSPGNAMAIL
jgi:kynurenine formamidase